VLAAVVGLVSLLLLPFIPILPGLGSVLALVLGVLSLRARVRPLWTVVAAILLGSLGVFLAAVQVFAMLLSAAGIVP